MDNFEFDFGDFPITDIFSSDSQSGGISVGDMFYLQDFSHRKFFLAESINTDSCVTIARHIMKFNAEDYGIPKKDRTPIVLYIASAGGEEDAGYLLIDTIKASKTPVITVNIGGCYSMAFLIFIVGHQRYSFINAKFMLHDGTISISNTGKKTKDFMQFREKFEEMTRRFVLENTKIDEETYDAKVVDDWYMTAEEAVENGVADYIIGQNGCELDEVVAEIEQPDDTDNTTSECMSEVLGE